MVLQLLALVPLLSRPLPPARTLFATHPCYCPRFRSRAAPRCHRQQMRDMLVVREQRKTDANVWQPVVEGPRCHRSGGCIHGSDGAGVAGAAAEAEMRVSRAMRYDNAVQQHVIQAWLDWLIQQEVRHQNKRARSDQMF